MSEQGLPSKDSPLISVITPSYNQASFVEQLMDSLIEQDYPNIEHIVVDGGSTDGTLKLLEEYEDKYRLRWVSEPDDGIPDALNKGIEMAEGEWIGFQSSDDYYLPGAFSYFEKVINSEVDVIYGDQLFVDADDEVIGLRVHTRPSKFIQKHWHHFASYHTVLIKKQLLSEIGGYDERYKYVHDGELFWRLLTTDREIAFVSIPRFLAARRKHDDNLSTTHGEPEQYAWEQANLYEYSNIEKTLPNRFLLVAAILLKSVYLLAEREPKSFYNMYLDLINKSLYKVGYDGRIAFDDRRNIEQSVLNYEF